MPERETPQDSRWSDDDIRRQLGAVYQLLVRKVRRWRFLDEDEDQEPVSSYHVIE